MLRELRVTHFAIIDRINVAFQSGFNVLSGETGSGKSVLLKSLALLMGEKSVSGTVKTGADHATVEGLFDISHRSDIQKRLEESGTELLDNSLVVKRIISADGKNRVYVNGGLSTLHQLREIVSPLLELSSYAAPLIEVTGQHENRNLLNRNFHLETLDLFANASSLRHEVSNHFDKVQKIRLQLSELEETARTKSQRLDFLYYQRDEIKGLNLKVGDEEELENQIHTLRDSGKLMQFVEMAESVLYSDDDSALVRLHKVLKQAEDLTSHNKFLAEKMDLLQQSKMAMEECIYQLRELNKNLDQNPNNQEELEQRLSNLRKVQKKYGADIEVILDQLKKIEDEISILENFENHAENLRSQLNTVGQSYQKAALKLHKLRQESAPRLSEKINAELEDLNMKGLIFSIQVEKLSEPSSHGITQIEFLIQTTKKDQPRSLAKFASGGELSRILLSLKCVVGISEYPRTFLFDEVDAGVSGVTAEKVGRKLSSIAKNQQVICVTHLPQVAAFADTHFVIEKNAANQQAVMSVSPLNKKDQVQEIARMLSGEKVTKSSLANARELLGL